MRALALLTALLAVACPGSMPPWLGAHDASAPVSRDSRVAADTSASSTSSSDAGPGAATPAADSASREVGVPPAAHGCGPSSLGPGKHSGTLEHDGLTRGYDVHVPQSYQAGHALPLVFYLHPLGMSNGYLQGAGNNPQKADDNGFIAVFPSGEGASWNAGACCGPSNGAGSKPAVDDVGFLRALLAQLSTELCIDAKRVYATGFSNGGFMSHRLACEAADIIAAIAPVSAVNGMTSCKPTRPVPVLMLNGTQDNLVPYQGGFGFPGITNGTFIGAQQTFQDWATRNGCTGSPQVTVSKGKATCHSYASCQGGAEVTLCTLDGAGHCWFGEMFCFLGTNSADVRATDLTWDFLRRFHLP